MVFGASGSDGCVFLDIFCCFTNKMRVENDCEIILWQKINESTCVSTSQISYKSASNDCLAIEIFFEIEIVFATSIFFLNEIVCATVTVYETSSESVFVSSFLLKNYNFCGLNDLYLAIGALNDDHLLSSRFSWTKLMKQRMNTNDGNAFSTLIFPSSDFFEKKVAETTSLISSLFYFFPFCQAFLVFFEVDLALFRASVHLWQFRLLK